MPDFDELRAICKKNSELSAPAVDEFLISYAAGRDNLEPQMRARLARFAHIARDLERSVINRIMAQYIAHRIFRKNGLIEKYLNHSALKRLDPSQQRYLEALAQYPWRYSFSVIRESPAEDFFEMEDVFTGESFLLYSPGVATTLRERPTILWFNLIGYNGACWQTFGPIGAYRGFEPDDIFYFATELNPALETDDDVLEDIENNPIPYGMLLASAAVPLVFHKEDQMRHVSSSLELDTFDSEKLKDYFKIAYAEDVYRLALKRWDGNPHYAVAYYDEAEKILQLTAMTDRGHEKLASQLRSCGFSVTVEPDVRVNMSMISFLGRVLRRDIRTNQYESLFEEERDPASEKSLDKINYLLSLALPEINANRDPDIEALAQQAGVDVETARIVLKAAIDKAKEMRGRFRR